jgi:uncharacterized protein (TIGR00266 family)
MAALARGEIPLQWRILGNNMPALVCELAPNEKVYADKGSMVYMSGNVELTAKARGGLMKGLARKALTGEDFFLSEFVPQGGPGVVAFAPHLPGRIIPFDLRGGKVLLGQKTAFLVGEDTVTLETAMQKKIMAGVFGGEGLIIQRYRGEGTVFLEALGDIIEMQLQPGQKMLVDTGKAVAWEQSVSYDVQAAGGLKTMAFGGEGVFLASLTGPGKIYLQTMSLDELRASMLIGSGR